MVMPVFQITDYAQAVAFYVDWLGFSVDWEERPAAAVISKYRAAASCCTSPTISAKAAWEPGPWSNSPACYRFTACCCKRNRSSRHPSVQKTTWNDKLQLLELFDIAGNCLMLAEVCA